MTDHGPGIPHQHRSTLFDKFTQAGKSRSKVKGSGLGLAITREIAQAHGGEVGFSTELGEGSVFFLSLPLSPKTTSES